MEILLEIFEKIFELIRDKILNNISFKIVGLPRTNENKLLLLSPPTELLRKSITNQNFF